MRRFCDYTNVKMVKQRAMLYLNATELPERLNAPKYGLALFLLVDSYKVSHNKKLTNACIEALSPDTTEIR